ncbi:MAG: DNA cytosine methyltransferase [Glaciecola sp.]
MNVLSLFDGMSCGQIALNRIGVKPSTYYASELDKYAIKVTQANYPDTVQLGDVTQWREWDIDWALIDLLIGGSPCQGFSFAGKQLAFDDPRSKLFFVYVDILNHIKSVNPNIKFMLENVKMKKEYLAVISEQLGVEPVFINSANYGPCERPRYYWFNWQFAPAKEENPESFLDNCVDLVQMGEGWVKWWDKNADFQQKKKYSKLVGIGDKGITMTARQYASWNGNFVLNDGKFFKPGKKSLARLVGASDCYFSGVAQRQAETLTGNGWTVDVVAHIFSQM